MSHACSIGGEKVELQWDHLTARSLMFRASKLGQLPNELYRQLQDPVRADYALGALLWLLAPSSIHDKHATPESLWLKTTDEETAGILEAVIGTLADSAPAEPEKKSTSSKSPSQELNSV